MASEDKARFSKEKHEYQMTPYAGQWKGMRAKKDPNAPKRSVHAFMWYSNDNRASIRVDRPNASVGEVAKVLSARWAQETPEVKAKYEQMAFEDKQRYEREKHEWHMSQREATIAQQAANNKNQQGNQSQTQSQPQIQYKPEDQYKPEEQYKPEPQQYKPEPQQYKPEPQQYKPEPQSQPQSQAPTPTPQQSQAPTPPMPQQTQPAPIAQRTITPSSR